ncbi:inositol monophosphatase [uncultured Agrobacterium sp.]|uniref:inositol monophosphatase family protein n=1 Tax=uncultured Agrobacterium sp. TaxID=157277 RepID=UPI0025D081ED|nr:inositol monophosphatase [uncultured Agrobacterium sp.]
MTTNASERTEIDDRRALAERIAKAAGAKARGFLLKPHRLETTQKSSTQDLVSIADRTTEAYLRKAIQKHFPDDGIVGEEAGSTRGTSGYIWVIDPIDGTMAFLVGQPNWSVSIAVLKNAEPVVGVVYAPVLRELYVGQTDRGATLNGRSLSINQDWTIRSTTIGYGGTERADPIEVGAFVTRLYQEGGVLFRVGSGALMLAYVAANRLAGYYDPTLYCWDCLAGVALIREAGGLAEFAGDLTKPGPIWAGNQGVFEHLKRLSA